MARNQGRRAQVRAPRPRLTQEQLIAAQVNRIINQRSETKIHGIKVEEAQWVVSTSVPLTYDLSAVAAGTLGGARVGNEITPTRLRIHGFLFNTNTSAAIRVRMMVIKTNSPYDLYDTGLTSTPDFYLDENNQPVSIGSCTTLGKFLYPVNSDKFEPVYDKQFSVYADGNANLPNRRFVIDLPLSGKIVFDKGNVGADNQTIRYHLVLLGSNENFDDTTITAELSFISQLFFKDL